MARPVVNRAARGAVLTRVVVIGGVLAVLGVGGWGATRLLARNGTAENGAINDTAVATVTSFDVTANAVGELQAHRQIELRNPLEQQTTITEIKAEGTAVKAGDVVVRLNSDQIKQQLDEETLRVESARADLTTALNALSIQQSENESRLRKAQLEVELSRLDLSRWMEGEVASKRQANDLAIEKAQRELERLRERFQRSVDLLEKGFLSRDEKQRDELAFLEAEAALRTAELNKKVYEEFEHPKDRKTKESAVAQAEAELERTARLNKSELDSKEAAKTNTEQQLQIREGRQALLRGQFESATIVAPSDGMVVHATSLNRNRWGGDSRGTMEVGRQTYPNEMILVLPDTSAMVAVVRVHESLAGRVREGQSAAVRVAALPGRSLRGTVQSIGVLAESGNWTDPNLREYTIRVRLDEQDTPVPLRPSMQVEAQIQLERVDNALTVPVQAVFSDGMLRYVLVQAEGGGGQFDRVPVSVGRRSDRLAEIRAGLTAGQRVLLRQARPGELSDREFTDEQLSAVGLMRNAEKRIVPVGGRGGAAGGPNGAGGEGRPPGAGSGAGRRGPGGPAGPGAAPGSKAPPAGGPVSSTTPAPGGTPPSTGK